MLNEYFNYLATKNYQSTIKLEEQIVNLYPESFEANIYMGRLYYRSGQFDLALENFKKAEMYATNKKGLVAIYSLLGSAYHLKGDLENALLYFSKSLRFAEELGDRSSELAQLNNIALIFRKEGELDKALNYLEKSLELATNENDKASRYNNIAVVYSDKGEYAKAIDYFKKAIESYTQYKAYETFKSIGAKAEARMVLIDLSELEQPQT